jgi:serine/threonine protein kinase
MSDDARQAMRTILENIDVPSVGDWRAVLERPGLMTWANYRPEELQFIGAGSNGLAFRFRDRMVLKITMDHSEADASNKIKGRRLSNVNRVYRVSWIKDSAEVDPGGMDLYAIVEAYLPGDLDEFEAVAVNDSGDLVEAFADETGQQMREIPWESRRTRREFLSFVDRFWADSVRKLFASRRGQEILNQIIRGLTSLRRAGVGYADLKADNVRKNAAGQLVIFDLGVSRTRDPNPMDVVEMLRRRR